MRKQGKMSEKLQETLSAGMDGEAGRFELRRALDEVGRNPHLQEVWERYHVVSAVLRGDERLASRDFGERVWQSLQSELPDVPTARLWRKPIAPVFAAAGLAIALMFAPEPVDEGPETEVLRLAGEPPPTINGAPPPMSQSEASPQDLQRIHAYMMHHVQHQAMHDPGLSSFAKLVTYAADGGAR